MDLWVFWYVVINFSVVGLVAIWRLKIIKRIINFYWKHEKPETTYRINMHYDNSMSDTFLINSENRKFKYGQGTYLITEDAVRHRRVAGLLMDKIDPIGDLHYIHNCPNPLIFKGYDDVKQIIKKTVKDENGKLIDIPMYDIDAKGLRDIEKNTLIRQLLTAGMQETILQTILILLIVIVGILTIMLLAWYGVIEMPIPATIVMGG